ncbi:MAG: AAA family ATPase [Nitrospirae bacterium]|nr:AAA family ATPase [Nitrospirota bacterium]
MENKDISAIKIRRLHIVNYKGIDEIELEFPMPRMADDPDVIVMGSRNGVGKTSVLECCALLLIGLKKRSRSSNTFESVNQQYSLDMPEMIIRSDAESARIDGDIIAGSLKTTWNMIVPRKGTVKTYGTIEETKGDFLSMDTVEQLGQEDEMDSYKRFVSVIKGMNPNPLLSKFFLYFHSYRKVQEGNPELGMMVVKKGFEESIRVSIFKIILMQALMSRGNLFEVQDTELYEGAVNKLNELMKRYAGGEIDKLRPSPDNTVDFRIQPINGSPSYTFDGLSSGQKEIIATLFLIWFQTRNKPAVVLIDEPELHLNARWHRVFVRQLIALAPDNQYIIATHSEDIFGSVDKDRRILIGVPSGVNHG